MIFHALYKLHILHRFSLLALSLLAINACSPKHDETITLPENMTYNLDINDYAGKWLVINYWAEWCAPCIREIPELNELDSHYASDINVVGVNYDHLDPESLIALSKKFNIEFDMVVNDPADQLKLSPEHMPTSYIFNPEGKLTYKLAGEQSKSSLLKHSLYSDKDQP